VREDGFVVTEMNNENFSKADDVKICKDTGYYYQVLCLER